MYNPQPLLSLPTPSHYIPHPPLLRLDHNQPNQSPRFNASFSTDSDPSPKSNSYQHGPYGLHPKYTPQLPSISNSQISQQKKTALHLMTPSYPTLSPRASPKGVFNQNIDSIKFEQEKMVSNSPRASLKAVFNPNIDSVKFEQERLLRKYSKHCSQQIQGLLNINNDTESRYNEQIQPYKPRTRSIVVQHFGSVSPTSGAQASVHNTFADAAKHNMRTPFGFNYGVNSEKSEACVRVNGVKTEPDEEFDENDASICEDLKNNAKSSRGTEESVKSWKTLQDHFDEQSEDTSKHVAHRGYRSSGRILKEIVQKKDITPLNLDCVRKSFDSSVQRDEQKQIIAKSPRGVEIKQQDQGSRQKVTIRIVSNAKARIKEISKALDDLSEIKEEKSSVTNDPDVTIGVSEGDCENFSVANVLTELDADTTPRKAFRVRVTSKRVK